MFFSNTVALAYDTAAILLPLSRGRQITSRLQTHRQRRQFEIWSMELWLQENERNASDEMNSSRWAKFNISTRGQ